jgi:hypothetical protein
MSKMTVTRQFHVRTEGRGRKAVRRGTAPAGRVPRVAKLLALAIHFEQLIRDGVVADQAELARHGQVTRARVTQIMDLLNLAPEIQEQIIDLGVSDQDGRQISERQLRPIAATTCWQKQWRAWLARNMAQ